MFNDSRDYKPDMTPTAIRLTHNIYIGRDPHKIGDVVKVGRQEANFIVAAKRAEFVER